MDGVERLTTERAETTPKPRAFGGARPRARTILPPQVVLVGASTGGPQALGKLVLGLASTIERLPICVTLHMPAELMQVMATHVGRSCGVETQVVTAPRKLLPGAVYFAPGDRHIDFRRGVDRAPEMHLKQSAPGEFCKPAVDVMFASAATCFGARALAVVLSGMGKDGLAGARALVAAGATVIAQDKASSAVWGMPGAIAKADLASAVLPPEAIAADIVKRLFPAGRSA